MPFLCTKDVNDMGGRRNMYFSAVTDEGQGNLIGLHVALVVAYDENFSQMFAEHTIFRTRIFVRCIVWIHFIPVHFRMIRCPPVKWGTLKLRNSSTFIITFFTNLS